MLPDYDLKIIPTEVARKFILSHHYSHTCKKGLSLCVGLFLKEKLTGVCIFSVPPGGENVRRNLFQNDNSSSVLELHRLAVLDEAPRNTESWFISRSLKLLKNSVSSVRAVLSFSDPTQNHVGTIYQATNAIYLGISLPQRYFVDETGTVRHQRINGKSLSLAEALQRNWKPIMKPGKHRYLFLLPRSQKEKKQLLKSISYPILPYPKQ